MEDIVIIVELGVITTEVIIAVTTVVKEAQDEVAVNESVDYSAMEVAFTGLNLEVSTVVPLMEVEVVIVVAVIIIKVVAFMNLINLD